LLVEQEVVVAEMRAADVPVEVPSRAGAVRGSTFLTLLVTGLPHAWRDMNRNAEGAVWYPSNLDGPQMAACGRGIRIRDIMEHQALG